MIILMFLDIKKDKGIYGREAHQSEIISMKLCHNNSDILTLDESGILRLWKVHPSVGSKEQLVWSVKGLVNEKNIVITGSDFSLTSDSHFNTTFLPLLTCNSNNTLPLKENLLKDSQMNISNTPKKMKNEENTDKFEDDSNDEDYINNFENISKKKDLKFNEKNKFNNKDFSLQMSLMNSKKKKEDISIEITGINNEKTINKEMAILNDRFG